MWHWLREKRHQAVRSSCPSPEGLDKTNSQSMNAKELELAITCSTLATLWSCGSLTACYSAKQFQFEEATAGFSVPLCNVSGSVHGSEKEYCLWIEHLSGYAATCLSSNPSGMCCHVEQQQAAAAAQQIIHQKCWLHTLVCQQLSALHPTLFQYTILQESCWSFLESLKEFLLYGWINSRWLSMMIESYESYISNVSQLNEVLQAAI